MRETWVWSLGWEDPLEKEMAVHSSILAWRIPWTEKPSRLRSTGSQRVGHDWATSPSPSASLYCNPPSSVILCLRVHCMWSPIYDSQTFHVALCLYEPKGTGKGSCLVALRLQTKFCTLFSVGEDFVANYSLYSLQKLVLLNRKMTQSDTYRQCTQTNASSLIFEKSYLAGIFSFPFSSYTWNWFYKALVECLESLKRPKSLVEACMS